MTAYYNEIDPYAAQWLRNLVSAGHIAPGDVDERSIVDVRGGDLRPCQQCHFFAGIGGWSYALRLAGWPDERPVWTGSCPCQPLSVAGKQAGHADERHLWPAFHRLIAECRPAIVFGEQVASKDGREWLAAVRADLEADGYACGCADLCAAGVGAPHIRQRLWFVADAHAPGRREQRSGELFDGERPSQRHDAERCGELHELAAAAVAGRRSGAAGGMDDSIGDGRRASGNDYGGDERIVTDSDGELGNAPRDAERQSRFPETSGRWPRAIGRSSAWSDCDWLPCIDGKARPTKPGIFPLAHGVSARVGKLRAAGNAIVPQLAAAFIEAAVMAREHR